MLHLRKKITLLYIPLLVTSISFIVIYSFINWFFIIRSNVALTDLRINCMAPFFFSGIVMLIWFNALIKELSNNEYYSKLMFRLLIILTLAAPTASIQYYLSTYLGKLTQLDNIKDIQEHEKTRYYTLKNYFIDTANYEVYSTLGHNFEKHQNLVYIISFYVAFPLFPNRIEAINSNPSAWLAEYYRLNLPVYYNSEQIASSLQAVLNRFKQNMGTINQFIYLEQVNNVDRIHFFEKAAKKSSKYDANNQFILYAVNEPFERRSVDMLALTAILLVSFYGIWFYIFCIFDAKILNRLENSKHRKFKFLG